MDVDLDACEALWIGVSSPTAAAGAMLADVDDVKAWDESGMIVG